MTDPQAANGGRSVNSVQPCDIRLASCVLAMLVSIGLLAIAVAVLVPVAETIAQPYAAMAIEEVVGSLRR